MAQYALDRVLSVAGSDVLTGNVIFLADQIVDPSLSFTAENEDIVDAHNNVVMVLENGRGATFGASNAFFNTQILAAQVGSEVTADTTAATTIEKYEIVTLGTGGKIELSSAIESLKDGAFTGKVYALTDDGSLTSADALTATYTAGKEAVGKEGEAGYVAAEPEYLTVTTTAKKVLVKYTTKVQAAEKLTAFADAKNKLMNVTAEVLLRDLCDESLVYAYLVMRGKLSGEAEWSMTRDGNHAFEIRCFPEYCGDKRLVDVILVND